MTRDDASIQGKRAGAKPKLRLRVKHRLGILQDLELETYPSRGHRDWLRVKGRVQETDRRAKPRPDAGLLRNAVDTLRRLKSDEVAGVSVEASFRGVSAEAVTDKEGYFTLRLDVEDPVEGGWHDVAVRARHPFEDQTLEATGRVLVPGDAARFAVISDLDDTIIRSHAADTWRQVRMMFGENAHTRPPFPGVAAFYRALQAGPDGGAGNPLFYLSRSGWNLYDLFEDFMEAHGFPMGPFFMTDLRVFEAPSQALGHAAPKLERCGILLENYHHLPFVLIGDSGQHDPETYREVTDRHPGRVKAVYIRDVTSDARDREVRAIADELAERGVPMILTSDTVAAAEHAAEHGLIAPEAVDEVREEADRERREDEPP